MKRAIGFERYHDIEYPPMYVRYAGGAVASTKAIDAEESVLLDLDADGEIVGIELVSVDDDTIVPAQRIAAERGLLLRSHLAHAFA